MSKQIKAVLILAAVLVVFFAVYIFLFSKTGNTGDSETVLRTENVEDIDSVIIKNTGGTFTFVRDNGTWIYKEDETFPINSAFLDSLEKGVTKVTAKRKLKKDLKDSAEYGLDEPQSVVTVNLKDGSSFKICVGNENIATTDYYISCEGADGIYNTKDTYAGRFCRTILDMASKSLIPDIDISDVEYIKAKTPEEEFEVLYSEDGVKLSYSENIDWFVKVGDRYYSSNGNLAKVFKDNIANISLDECVAYKPDSKALNEFGITDSDRVYEMKFTDQGKEITEVLKLGNETTQKNADGSVISSTYVYFENEDIVFVSNNDSIAGLLNVSVDALRSPRVSKVEFEEIEAMDMTTLKEEHHVDFERSTEKDLNGGDMTVVTYVMDGNALDDDSVWDITYTVNSMKAEGFPADEITAEVEPEVTVTFYRNTQENETITVSYYKYDNNFYLANTGYYESFLVNRKDIENLIDQIENY